METWNLDVQAIQERRSFIAPGRWSFGKITISESGEEKSCRFNDATLEYGNRQTEAERVGVVSDLTCSEKLRLLDQLKKLVQEYMLSVQTMTATVGTADFYTALEKCQKFRAAMHQVKKELNDHAMQHRC
jgi:hypothetical protein